MSGLGDDYCAEIDTLQDNCRTLRDRDPDNEYLQLIEFDKYGQVLIKLEFWKRFGPEDKEIPHYNLHALAEANKQLEETIREAEQKGLASKLIGQTKFLRRR
jgi:hypothetical protein